MLLLSKCRKLFWLKYISMAWKNTQLIKYLTPIGFLKTLAAMTISGKFLNNINQNKNDAIYQRYFYIGPYK